MHPIEYAAEAPDHRVRVDHQPWLNGTSGAPL